MFENLMMPQLGSNSLGGASSAVMHLFTPRLFSDQGKRPIAYKFDGAFVNAAVDAISYKTESQDGSKIDAITRNPNFMRAIVPTLTPDYMINMNQLSYYWTFMLIVNNDKTGSGGLTRAMADNLQLYYGYFLDEPVNPNSHMGRLTINPNAALMITHKTIVNKSSSVGQYGTTIRLDTMADIDVIPTHSMAALSNRRTVSMRPEDLYENVSADLNGDVVIMHNESKLLGNMGESLDISSKLSVPKNNIKKVLDAAADTQSSLQASAFEGALVDFGQNSFDQLFSQNLQDGARQIDIGLSTNIIITMEHVMTRYNPKINPVKVSREQPYAALNQQDGSAKNVFSSMLANVLPAIMSDFVLAQIAFRYDSYATEKGAKDYEIDVVAPMVAMPDEELRGRVNAFMFRLKSEIFPILKLQRGDFNLQVNCDSTSITHIVLNFYADSMITDAVFEVPTLLGGFNNPLIGSSDMADANSKQFGAFVAILRGDDRDIPLGSYDAASYNRSMLAYDASQTSFGESIPLYPKPNQNEQFNPTPRNWNL